jgi:hypothetical protein
MVSSHHGRNVAFCALSTASLPRAPGRERSECGSGTHDAAGRKVVVAVTLEFEAHHGLIPPLRTAFRV